MAEAARLMVQGVVTDWQRQHKAMARQARLDEREQELEDNFQDAAKRLREVAHSLACYDTKNPPSIKGEGPITARALRTSPIELLDTMHRVATRMEERIPEVPPRAPGGAPGRLL